MIFYSHNTWIGLSDALVESKPPAAILRFPGPALGDATGDAAATAGVGGTGRALAYITLSGEG